VNPAVEGEDGAAATPATYVSGGVRVINLTGFELPSTGGMGTTLFYTIGGLMMAGAAVLLITKKRLANEQ
jgi:LPXTG-motif cell wall-anchored protein